MELVEGLLVQTGKLNSIRRTQTAAPFWNQLSAKRNCRVATSKSALALV